MRALYALSRKNAGEENIAFTIAPMLGLFFGVGVGQRLEVAI